MTTALPRVRASRVSTSSAAIWCDEIEMRRRLVEQQEVGVLRQERGQRDAAPLAAGERAQLPRGETGEADVGERAVRALDVGRGLPLPAREMRMAADQHRFQHRGGKEVDAVLRQPAAAARTLARRERRERRAVVRDLARVRRAQAGEGGEQRRLAGAVRPDDRPGFAGADVEIEAGAQRAPGTATARPRHDRRGGAMASNASSTPIR